MIEEELFNKAVALRGEDRIAFLDQACAGDAALRAAVEALLRADEVASGYLDPRGLGLEQTEQTTSPGEQAGKVVAGRYKLLEPIGEGGMGTVWLAEQTEPVKRKVALKLVKPGMDSKAVLARFEAERQALALMDHPNIARVHDGGVTEEGRPYFVMELVKGLPLTEYCDARRMNIRERLELFVPICSAVQHAHQKGIIHRDLKPSNILVTEHDGRPIPKVIDFGLAKALSAATTLTERTLHTAFGTVVGTPLYMAPEQVAVNALDVDTRTDIYSLGVILYELLTGTTPLEKQRFKEAAWEEVRRVIREEEPPKPSLRLSDSHDSLPSISAQRHTEPAALTRLVRGEIDWIVMKALEKDRNRRYETANGFSMDVQRYLADEPVQACPPSTAYRFKKFVRRNKASVVAASLVFLAIVAGVVGASWGLVSARAAAAREATAREQAETNFALAGDAVEEFLGAVTDDPDLNDAGLNHVRKKLLVKAVPFFQKIAEQKSDDPKLQASRGLAYRRLTIMRQKLGEYEAALQDSEAGRTIFAKLVAEYPHESWYRHALANFIHNSALSHSQLGKRQEAETGYRQAISMMEKLVAESPSEGSRNDLARGYADLGNLLREIGKRSEAETAFRQALSAWEALGRDLPTKAEYQLRQASTHNVLGLHFIELSKYEEGEKAFRRALAIGEEIAQTFPEQAPNFDESSPLLNLGVMFEMQGKLQEALAPTRRAVEIREKFASQYPTSPAARRQLSHSLNQQGNVLRQLGKSEEALAAFRRALGIRERLAEEYPNLPMHRQRVAESLMGLGNALISVRKYAEAESVIKRALEYYERLAAEHPDNLEHAVSLGGLYCNLGFLKVDAGEPKVALGWYEKAIARLEEVLAKEPQLADAKEFLANSYGGKIDALHGLGRHADTIKWSEQTYDRFKGLFGPTHPQTVKCLAGLIEIHDFLKRFDAALKLRREMLEIRRQTLGPDHSETLGAMANVAIGYANLGNHAEAIKLREEVLALMKAKIPNHNYRLRTLGALAASYDADRRPADAKKTREEAIAVVRSRLSAGDPSALNGALALARGFTEDGRGADAIAVIDDSVRKMAGKSLDTGVVVQLLELRLLHFVKAKDLAGVRATADYFERLNLEDAAILYDAACCRAVAAAFVRAAGGKNAAKDAAAEADRAMEWLLKAVVAGWKNVAHMKSDCDLDALRDRDDFKKLLADLEAKRK